MDELDNKIVNINIEIVKVQQAIDHLKEVNKELKDKIKDIDGEIHDKSEEIKDIFYLAETTRQKLEELSESIRDSFKEYDLLFNKKEDRRDKKILTMAQALVTIAAIIYAVVVGHGG